MRRSARSTLLLLFVTPLVPPADARGAPQQAELLNLFFDCPFSSCSDFDFFRRGVPFVNWVRDREASDVHVLVTSQPTGGGGDLFRLTFIGLGSRAGMDQELTHVGGAGATEDDVRNGLIEKLKIGLVRYVQDSPVANRLRLVYEAGDEGAEGEIGAEAVDDRWDSWVFTLNGNGFINGQATSSFSNFFGVASANRTTAAWKFELEGTFSRNVQEFEVPEDDGTTSTVREVREDWGGGGSIVRSVGARWAMGLEGELGSSTFLNQDLRATVKPGLEFNFFPYSESSRRSLTLQYLVGPNHFSYDERTIFDETEETRVQESLTARLAIVAPWGRWNTSLSGAHYLHDTSRYNVALFGNINVRLFQGFSVRVSGNYTWIRDQLYVSAEGATEAEILLQQRQLETGYRYFTSFGIEYRFGSVFNNVVNPRFGPNGSIF